MCAFCLAAETLASIVALLLTMMPMQKMLNMLFGVHPLKLRLLAALCTWQALGGSAFAADSSQAWPEVSAFIGLRPEMRVYLDATYAKGKEPDLGSLDATAALDISIKPILRPALQSEDWQRNRYLWARIGYTRISDITDEGERSLVENRGF